IKLPVHVRIGQENLGYATFKNHVENLGLTQFIERLGGEHKSGVVFAPSFQCFNDVGANTRVLEKNPRFIDKKCLKHVAEFRFADDGIGPMQHVKQKRFKDLWIFPHALEVEALKA